MDRLPSPGMPEEQDAQEELRNRLKRLFKKEKGFEEPRLPRVIDLSGEAPNETDTEGELWSRDAEAIELQSPQVPAQAIEIGRRALEQSEEVLEFAEEVGQRVDELPEEARNRVKPEADRLEVAATELQEATKELGEELVTLESAGPQTSAEQPDDTEADASEVDESGSEPESADAPEPAPAEAAPASVEKPKKERETTAVVNLLAALVGGGLGTILVGEGRKRNAEQKIKKEAVQAKKALKEKETKLAVQEAELQKLKAEQAKQGGQAESKREHVKKAADLTERQTELTQVTTEQVREVAKAAAEVEQVFRIPESPERRVEKSAPAPEKTEHTVQTERFERARGEHFDRPSDSASNETVHAVSIESRQNVQIETAKTTATDQADPLEPKADVMYARTWIYGLLVAAAILVAAALLIFG